MNDTTILTYSELQLLIDMVEIELSNATQLTRLKTFDGGDSLGYDGKRGELQTIIYKLEDMRSE